MRVWKRIEAKNPPTAPLIAAGFRRDRSRPSGKANPPTAPMAIQMPPWIKIGDNKSFGSAT